MDRPVVVGGRDLAAFVEFAPEGPLGVPPVKLPVVEPGGEGHRPLDFFGNPQPVAHGVGGARRNRGDVEHAPRRPGVSFVDRVAVGVEEQRTQEVGGTVHRGVRRLAGLTGEPAPEEGSPGSVLGAELEPDLLGIDRAAREEVADVAGPHHHIHPHRLARDERGKRLVKGRAQLAERPRRGIASGRRCRFLADREGGGERQRVGAAGEGFRPRRFPLVVAHETEDVHRHLSGAQEIPNGLELLVEPEVGRERGVCGGEAVRAEQAVPRRRVLAGDRRHVAVGARPGGLRVVKRARAVSRNPARLPVVVAVETPEPAVIVDGLVEMHLVAGGAKRRAVAGVERFQEGLAMGFGIEMDYQVVERPDQRVLGSGEVVHLGVFDDEAGVPHGVLHPGDRVAGNAAESGARGGAVHDLGDRPIHLAAEEHRVVMAAGAPLGGSHPHHALHVLDGAPVPGVVEGGEAVGGLAPLVGDVAVAAAALVALEEELLGDEPAVLRFRRRGEERPVRAAHRFAGHGCRGQAGVQHRSAIG